jgi:glycerophosphoryl diester phosphodiesterase
MKNSIICAILFSFVIAMNSCNNPNIDVQGHRGFRGLYPENTIIGFQKAAEIGVNTLEMDVVISGDGKVVVSHDPFILPEICLHPERIAFERVSFVIYQMSFDSLKAFDCGSKGNERFPDQSKLRANKPLLSEVLEEFESGDLSLQYNIELKSTPTGDGVLHPGPEVFSDIVMTLLKKYNLGQRLTIQCFDPRILNYFHRAYPKVKLAYLIEGRADIDENLELLEFIPEIYSCDYGLLNADRINHCHELGMQVIPWTVNKVSDMQDLMNWGVDGIITDYPDRLLNLLKK